MSGVELVLAFRAGVVMGGAFGCFVLPLLGDSLRNLQVAHLGRNAAKGSSPTT